MSIGTGPPPALLRDASKVIGRGVPDPEGGPKRLSLSCARQRQEFLGFPGRPAAHGAAKRPAPGKTCLRQMNWVARRARLELLEPVVRVGIAMVVAIRPLDRERLDELRRPRILSPHLPPLLAPLFCCPGGRFSSRLI